jgi:hypothetical protein
MDRDELRAAHLLETSEAVARALLDGRGYILAVCFPLRFPLELFPDLLPTHKVIDIAIRTLGGLIPRDEIARVRAVRGAQTIELVNGSRVDFVFGNNPSSFCGRLPDAAWFLPHWRVAPERCVDDVLIRCLRRAEQMERLRAGEGPDVSRPRVEGDRVVMDYRCTFGVPAGREPREGEPATNGTIGEQLARFAVDMDGPLITTKIPVLIPDDDEGAA